jgi:hypothetical protein
MSNRRKFLAGLGALASGSAAAIGTGAFTSVEADRTVNVAVADDASAYLSLDDIDSSPNSEYVDTSSEEIVLNLNSTNSGGSGFNANAETRIDDLIQVANQGTQTINVWVTLSGGSTFDDDTLYFYPGDTTDTALNDGEGDSDDNDVLELGTGESADIGAFVDLGDVSSTDEEITATFHASTKRGDGTSTQVDESGQVQNALLQSDPASGTGDVEPPRPWITTEIEPGPVTTITVELDGEVYGNTGTGLDQWPANESVYFFEVNIDVDNDGLGESQNDDFRFGYAAASSGARAGAIANDRDRAPDVSGDGGYLRRNNGQGSANRVDIGEENLDGFTAEESGNQLTYTFTIDWQQLANETGDGDNNGLALNSAPDQIVINEVFGGDGGEGVGATPNSSNDGRGNVDNRAEGPTAPIDVS